MKRWLAALAVAAGCGTGSGGGGPPPATLADAEAQLERAFCQYAARCGEIGASEEKACETAALSALQTFHVSYYSGWIDYATLDDAVAAGRQSFNNQIAASCIDPVRNARCGTALDVAQACLKAFSGVVAPGGACKAPGDCATGFCITSGTSCTGTCQSQIAAGSNCDGFVDACAAGSYCSSNTRLCTSFAASGATCEWLGQTQTCQSGLYCDAFMHQCKAQGAAGAKCSFDGDCQSGLRCSPQLKCVTPSAEGGSCQQPSDCAAGSFCVGAAAAANGMPAIAGTCRAAMGQSGDPCATGSCAHGLYCDTSSRPPICRGLVAAGGACPVASACADGTTCAGSTCIAFLDSGGACDPTRNVTGCPNDMRCDATAKTCAPVGTLASSCGTCRRLLYCDPTMKCAPQLAPGAACTPPSSNGSDPCAVGTCDSATKVCAAQSC